MDKKRIAIIVGFSLITLILGYALYRVFFASKTAAPTPPPPADGVTPTTGVFPTSDGTRPGATPTSGVLPKSGGATPVGTKPTAQKTVIAQNFITQPVIGAATDSKGNVSFYNNNDGKFYRFGADGRLALLSDQIFYSVDNITWSPTGDSSILEYPDGSNIYYNFNTKKQATLPKHWEAFSFSEQGDKIAAKSIGFSEENRWLVASDPDGKNVSLIAPLGNNADKVDVDWSPNNQIVALSRTGEALGADREEVLFIGLHGENFKSTVVEGRGFVPEWSPDGKKLLYSVYSARSDFKPELWIVGAEGDNIGSNRKLLNVNTWADKCTFADARFVYCGVPQTLDTGAGFAPELAATTPDIIYKIDTETGLRTQIPLQNNPTIGKIFLSPDKQTLYFTDTVQTGVFQVGL